VCANLLGLCLHAIVHTLGRIPCKAFVPDCEFALDVTCYAFEAVSSLSFLEGTPMSKITRRTLIRDSGLAVSALTFIPAGLGIAAGENRPERFFHAFAFRWKPDVSEAQKDKAAKEIAALQGKIPGLLETHVGPNISPRSKGYEFGGIMLFKDKASLDAYPRHPAHQALLSWLVPLVDAIELDLGA
jgi:hypothetical protein